MRKNMQVNGLVKQKRRGNIEQEGRKAKKEMDRKQEPRVKLLKNLSH